LRVALKGALLSLAAAAALQGCAVGMLKGAAGSGSGGSSSSAPTRTSAPSPAPTSSSAKQTDDAISTSVRSRFAANASLKGLNIAVDTHDGIVTLRGQVAKVEQKSAAEANARSVRGVRAVQNLITVRAGQP